MHETEVEVYVDEEIVRTTEKLSIVSELSELPDVPSPDEDYDLEQVTTPVNSISEKIDVSTKLNDRLNEEHIGRIYSASPTFSDFSS
ncbi:hypothetical protein HZH68_014786 [Vespula germanica]|uniref:Uncharacterized protein n=1 Tax=Vespula germanica TaxID=30212 RepID=A0A834JBK6_VESGE|nr:hypothetical protein HZH68_014786 [Vespula germanica]